MKVWNSGNSFSSWEKILSLEEPLQQQHTFDPEGSPVCAEIVHDWASDTQPSLYCLD